MNKISKKCMEGVFLMGTLVVGFIVLVMLTAAVMSMVKDKKSGKSIQCGGDCSHCGGHCH